MIKTGYDDYGSMKWKEEFSVGSWEIDGQHKKLMNFYNDVLGNCSGDAAKEREYFDNTIEEFINLLSEHFDTEEQIFFGTDYAEIDGHILDHLKLLEKINFVKKEAQNNNWKMKLHILAITLKDWFLYHFESYDLSAKEYLRKRGGIKPDSMRQAVSA